MISLGALSFFTPLAFAGFLVLPLVWWVVRLTPPRPRRVRFPAIRLLAQVTSTHQSSHSYPWWLLILRLVMTAMLITGAAAPVYNPQSGMQSTGPIVIIVDDGWASAVNWKARVGYLEDLVVQAERQARGIILLTTATPAAPRILGIQTPAEALESIRALRPKPWQTDRSKILQTLEDPALALNKAGRIVWLGDGLQLDDIHEVPQDNFSTLLMKLSRLGPVTIVQPAPGHEANALFPPYGDGESLIVPVRRAHQGAAVTVSIIAYDNANRSVGRAAAAFETGALLAEARLELPVEIRNRIEQLRIEGEHSAAAVVLLDERWRRRPVGLVNDDGIGDDQPLLSGQYYVDRALQALTEVRSGSIDTLLDRETAVMILADPAPLDPVDLTDLTQWVNHGGVLVVFAGPRMASLGSSDSKTALTQLLPVTLRSGDRAIGGAMSWRRPAAIAPFEIDSPFRGLIIPNDVRIQRQVLAEPTLELDERTWARLSDGTPLVTARPQGEGMVVLFHVTANAEWSNLPLSGLFVDMLQRVTEISHGVGTAIGADNGSGSGSGLMTPQRTLDGTGNLTPPPASAIPLTVDNFELTAPSPRHPPGFYGTRDVQRALNLTSYLSPLRGTAEIPDIIARDIYGRSGERTLTHWFFIAAALLLGLDMMLSLWLRGIRIDPVVTARTIGASLMAACLLGSPLSASAQDLNPTEARTIEAANLTRIAYVISGDKQTDAVSRLGLAGLGTVMGQRTAVELGPPDGIDPAVDEMAVYPMIYWPITESTPIPSAAAAHRINTFLANGGMIFFDAITPGGAKNSRQMRRFATVLDIPRLTTIPDDHVLTRAFYLLRDFPGRWAGNPVWIVPSEERVNDGVSPIIAGGNHWAAAWAIDQHQQPLFAVVPGGERQREYAYRFGINLVMYVLTGNYKGDQVHLPIILNRLGQ